MGLELGINASCLIPRPDTECVVEQCLKLLTNIPKPVVYDIATGSGAIALALLSQHPGLRVIASDISPEALLIAASNSATWGFGPHKFNPG